MAATSLTVSELRFGPLLCRSRFSRALKVMRCSFAYVVFAPYRHIGRGRSLRIGSEEARITLSNTGDRGYQPTPADEAAAFDQVLAYPVKLFHLLAHRHSTGSAPLSIFPMELVPENGAALKAHVFEIAAVLGSVPIDLYCGPASQLSESCRS